METSTDRVDAPLALFGAIHRAAVRAEWAAAQATGLDIHVVDDGEILLGAAPDFPSTMFNRALGFAEAPDRVGEAVAFFAEQGVQGDIVLDPADVPPGVTPRLRLEAYLADPTAIPRRPYPAWKSGSSGPATRRPGWTSSSRAMRRPPRWQRSGERSPIAPPATANAGCWAFSTAGSSQRARSSSTAIEAG